MGLDSGAHAPYFGSIRAVEAGPDGIAIVDDLRDRVTLHDAGSGRLLAVAGGPGPGPEEFESPRTARFGDDGTLFVLDQRKRTVSRISRTDYRFQAQVVIPLQTEDFCLVEDMMYVLAFGNEGQLHQLAPDGSLTMSWSLPGTYQFAGNVPASIRESVHRNESASGLLSCGFSNPVVVVARYQLGIVVLVNPVEGTSRSVQLPEFLPGIWRQNERGAPVTTAAGRDSRVTVVEALARLDSVTAVVQTATFSPGARSDGVIQTVLLNTWSGALSVVEGTLPIILSARDSRAFVGDEEPAPFVEARVVRRR